MALESRNRPYANLDAVIFDLDGVILDSVDVKTRAFGTLYAKYGEQIRAQVEAYHLAHGGVSRYDKFRYFQKELIKGPFDEKTIEELSQKFSQLAWNGVINSSFIPGANQTLRLLSAFLPIFVASGTPNEEVSRILQIKNLKRFFTGAYGSPSSKLEILNNIVNSRNYRPGRCVMVGDSLTDFSAAMAARMLFIGVGCNARNPVSNRTRVIRDLRALPNSLKSLFTAVE